MSGALRAAAAVGAAAALWGTLVERRWYALRSVTLPVLRAGTSGCLRVLHLSDLHLLPGQAPHLEPFLDRCRGAGADLVVATGDLLGWTGLEDEAVALLQRAKGGAAGLVVLGSNDYWAPRPKSPFIYFREPTHRRLGAELDTHRLRAGLRADGWRIVDNVRERVATAIGDLDVVGLGDPHLWLDRPDRITWAPPADDTVVGLGLVHAPYTAVLDRFERTGFDVVLAGHTHGGQVRVPGYGALVANCDLPLRQARGASRVGGRMRLHVSAGLGHSRYAPVRFACRPEATVIDLVPAQVNASRVEARPAHA